MSNQHKFMIKNQMFWLKFSLFALVLSLLVQCNQDQVNQAVVNQGEVSFIIRDGKTEEKLIAQLKEKSDLLTIMEGQKTEQKLSFEIKGMDEMAFVESLNGVKNEGPGDDKRNWIFAVNGKLANQGIGRLQASAGDVVVWCFSIWKDRDQCK